MVANVAAVDAAVIAVLAADAELAALVPDGVWRDVAPAGSTRAVTVQLQTHEDLEGFRMPLYEAFRYRIVAHVLETSGATADAAAARMHVLLQDQVLEAIAGYTHMATLRVERVRVTDPDLIDNDLRWQLAGGDDEITVSPGDPGPPVVPLVPYAEQVIADGASAYWRLGDACGTIAIDEVGFAHGTISGGVTLAQPGAIADGDTAMVFDGATGKIVTAAPVSLVTPYTIEAWLRTVGTSACEVISTRLGYPTLDVVRAFVQPFNGQWTLVLDYGNGTAGEQAGTAGGFLHDGAWHYVVVTVTASGCVLYTDGAAGPSYTFPIAFTGAPYPLTLGQDVFGGYGTGSLDDIAIYPRALTPAEIAAHYTAGTSATTARTFRHRKD